MPARLNYEPCPHCGDIRNTQGMKAHINKKHPEAVAANA